ncbi:AT-rich interactive domain-containing protein 2 [Canna indica]|uniref:AT-rich interactive domain-containing protein 2 n=1 Tax=Canna indica TaxID=4628 RepID=A0AAQ3KFA7_9LILI|nr:AT-rich interactive domain-containing protein 2 [Canna indica]
MVPCASAALDAKAQVSTGSCMAVKKIGWNLRSPKEKSRLPPTPLTPHHHLQLFVESFSFDGRMALSANGTYLDVVEILHKLQSIGFCSDLDVPERVTISETSSSLFDRILSAFWKEVNRNGEIRQLPPMVGAGHPVDLLMLYSSVQDRGGYDRVTENCAWASVAQAIGLEFVSGSSLKLVFFKYLDALDRWLQRVSGKKVAGERPGYKSLHHLKTTKSYGAIAELKNTVCQSPPSSSKKDQFLSPVKGSGFRPKIDTGENDNNHNNDVVTLGTSVVCGGISHHKRKQEALVGMLNWVKNLAKTPNCYYVGKSTKIDNLKCRGLVVSEHYSQALLARQALFFKRLRRSSPEANNEQKGNPSICTNGNGTIYHTEMVGCRSGQVNGDVKHRRPSSKLGIIASWLSNDQKRMRIPMGRYYQAIVPLWTGKPSVSSIGPHEELKWLGTRTWPPEGQENELCFDSIAVGRGRQDTCQCLFPGSIECTRFHIAENRLLLKRELGPPFHAWGFRSMGEEVSLSWTEDEELKFKAIVNSNRPSMDKNFWNMLHLYFPFKKRRTLVSYYFNVFLLGRRRYQNRVTHNIDSDDDEPELGFSSNRFGQGRIKIHDSFPIICTHNMQCMDIDE